MTIDINQFWNLLSGSKLLSPERHQSLFTEFVTEFNRSTDFGDGAKSKNSGNSSGSTGFNSPESVANWLVKQKAISSYQAKILLAGENGPFHYGNYTITARIASGPLAKSFRARHRQTDHPVLLQFVAGKTPEDLEFWRQIEALSTALAPVKHPNLIPIHETVALQNFRFVVSGFASGKSLEKTVPRKGRMPWADACQIMGAVACAVGKLHEQNLVCLLYTSPSPRDLSTSRMPSSA